MLERRQKAMPKAKEVHQLDVIEHAPAYTEDARQSEMIALAIDCAEAQLRAGTASSQVITHYLKLATTKEKLELEMLELQKELVKAKTESLREAKNLEKTYTEAISAMRRYSGVPEPDYAGDSDDD